MLIRISFQLRTLFIGFMICQALMASAEDDKKLIYRLEIAEEITPGMARKASQAVNEAVTLKADFILISMNTYGGMLDAADSIRTRFLNSPIPIIVFIDNNAASAGALIAIACNRIYMRPGSSIGAATVVNQNAEALPDKYQSYMRAMMRATAEARGRNPRIAEAMVDPRSYIPNVNDSGKVLTFTPSEALKHGYCDGTADNWREVLAKEGITNYDVKIYDPTWVESIIGFLIHPGISGVLILVMLGGIYFEMQSPGIGIPLFAAILAAILYFAPLYLEGLAANWEILLFIIGMALILVEIFIIPGFGIAGIAGIICVVTGLSVSMLNNKGFDFSGISTNQILTSVSIVILSMGGSLIVFFTLGKGLMSTPAFNKLILKDSLPVGSSNVFMASGGDMIGQEALATTPLMPGGKILFNGEVISASSEFGYIEKGSQVVITRYDGIAPMVRLKKPDESTDQKS